MQVTAEIPDAVADRIAAAFASRYPDLTQGRRPSDAVLAVIQWLIRQIVLDYEMEKARVSADGLLDAAQAKRAQLLAATSQQVNSLLDAAFQPLNTPPDDAPAAEGPS